MTNLEPLDIPARLRHVHFFQDCSPEVLTQVAAATHAVRLGKGDTLFQEGDAPKFLYVVASGQIKEAVRSAQGNEKIIEIIGPHQTVGEAALMLDRPYPFFAESLHDAWLLCVPKTIIFELLETRAEFAKRMVAGLCMRLHALVRDIESHTLQTAEQRFVAYLIENGRPEHHGGSKLRISLPATRLAIASRLGMAPETLSRIIRFFTDAGLIAVKGKQFLIPDIERLSRYAT